MPVRSKENLFTAPENRHHIWYRNMYSSNSIAAKIQRDFCEKVYSKNFTHLDANFTDHFRLETPARFSELFFLDGFLTCGWKITTAPTGFDFAFVSDNFEKRILVEVVMPKITDALQKPDRDENGVVVYGGGQREKDFTLSRLTNALDSKGRRMREALENQTELWHDYKIVAISGFDISQRGLDPLDADVLMPDWTGAFLPIGEVMVDVHADRTKKMKMSAPYHKYSPTLKKNDTKEIPRDSFLSGEYPYVDAVVFSNVHLDGGQIQTSNQMQVLRNPTSNWRLPIPSLGIDRDLSVKINDEGFTVRPSRANDYS